MADGPGPGGDGPVSEAPLPVGDLSCMGRPLATTAKDPIRVYGGVVTYDQKPLAGVTVKVLKSDDSVIGMADTAADGSFSINVPSGGKPLDAHVVFSKSGFANTYLFSAEPYADDPSIGIAVFKTSELSFLYTLSGSGLTWDSTKATVAQGVVDCGGNPLENATVTFSPAAGGITYMSGANPPTYRQTGTFTNGLGLGLNVPAAASGQAVQVGAKWKGTTFRTYTARMYPGQFTVTVIHP